MTVTINFGKLNDEGRERAQDLIRQKRNHLGPEHHDDVSALRVLLSERQEAITASREAKRLQHYFEHPDAVAPATLVAAQGLGIVTNEDCACA